MSILCYHQVDPNWRGPLGLSPKSFREHCAWLARNRRVLPLAQAVELVRPSGRLPGRGIAITFDDGLAGIYAHALPALVAHGLPASVFLVAQTLTAHGQPVDWIGPQRGGEIRTLSADEVREMQSAGVSFGSHSYAHRNLTRLGDTEIERDLRVSKEVLEDVLDREVWCLAYPGGFHNSRVRQAARRAGFTHAVGVTFGGPAKDSWSIPRVGVYARDGTAALRVKSSSWYPAVRLSPVFPVMRRVIGDAR